MVNPIEPREPLSLWPPPPENTVAYAQWQGALKLVTRLPRGLPTCYRRKVWVALADNQLRYKRKLNWRAISDRCFENTPVNETISTQIVNDLHRSGSPLFSEKHPENLELLNSVLLAYARYNPNVGYCQGFNILAAVILEVLEFDSRDSFLVLVYLLEEILPEGYFTNEMRGLSIDLNVFNELMESHAPKLILHMDRLRMEGPNGPNGKPAKGHSAMVAANDPPMINAFTLKWFVTLFATTLNTTTLVRVWDLILLEGNEVIMRTALAIWQILQHDLTHVHDLDALYMLMNIFTHRVDRNAPGFLETDRLVHTLCNMGPFPDPDLARLREKFSENGGQEQPNGSSLVQLKKGLVNMVNNSVQKLMDSEFNGQINMLQWCVQQWDQKNGKNQSSNQNGVSSNFLDLIRQVQQTKPESPFGMDMFKRHYNKLKQHQKQAQIMISEGLQNSRIGNESFSMSRLFNGKNPLVPPKPAPSTKFEVNQIGTSNMSMQPGPSGVSTGPSKADRMARLSSASSTSTELCDEAMGYKSDPEGEDVFDEHDPDLLRMRRHSKSVDQLDTIHHRQQARSSSIDKSGPENGSSKSDTSNEEDVFAENVSELDQVINKFTQIMYDAQQKLNLL